jgi:SAM-dependent methyltransferase
MAQPADYQDKLRNEAAHWGQRLKVELLERHAWLDHPRVGDHYKQRALVNGKPWESWIVDRLGEPCARSLELGCGTATRSLQLFERHATREVAGVDLSADRVAEGEALRNALRAPGRFHVADANTVELPRSTYDLIFACHSFHHFQALEHLMDQIHGALTPRGLFVLEEYVGPTQFQWTDTQIALVKELTALLPERLRTFRWGAVKSHEGRPTREAVAAVSPFESIRSADIVPLFVERFQIVAARRLGGTLQHLLYNGIIHNFADDDEEAHKTLESIWQVEDALIDAGLLPSDFQLLIGRA